MTTPINPLPPTSDPQVNPYPAALSTPSNGMGVTGLVTGIIGACLAWLPGIGFILGVLGIVFGSIGWHYAKQGRATNKGMAIAGVILGVLAVAFWPILIIIAAVA
jgi:Domain of unknown function (DUF4190)